MFYDSDEEIYFKDFAITGLLLSTKGGSKPIRLIFDNNYQAVNVDTGIVESAYPLVLARSIDVKDAEHRDRIEINNTTYYIKSIEDDGTGFTRMELSKD